MKNMGPLLLLGGAALLVMGGRKKTVGRPTAYQTYKGYVSGKNSLAAGSIKGLFEAANLKAGRSMFDIEFIADPADLGAWFYEPSWAHADAIIVMVNTSLDELAGAWVAPGAIEGPDGEIINVAGAKAKGMTLKVLGTIGIQEAAAVARGETNA